MVKDKDDRFAPRFPTLEPEVCGVEEDMFSVVMRKEGCKYRA